MHAHEANGYDRRAGRRRDRDPAGPGASAGPAAGRDGGRGPAGGRHGAPPPAVVDGIPNLAGTWDGGGRARPVNGENVPWVKGKNYPELNERGLAFVKIFDEALAPKYDCFPSTSPAIQYDPYSMEVVQWPDRVLLRYEKDDQLRTVWMDGRKPRGQRVQHPGFLGRQVRRQRAARRNDAFRLRHHGLRRLQRHSFLAAENRAGALLARRTRSARHGLGRGSHVPAEADRLHDAVDSDARPATGSRRSIAIRNRRARQSNSCRRSTSRGRRGARAEAQRRRAQRISNE